jgi:PQQ-dependent dehydrogenase (methanol/ethanol family)
MRRAGSRIACVLVVLGLGCGERAEQPPAPPAPVPAPEAAPPPAPTPAAGRIDAARAVHADAEPGSWLLHGRTYGEQRHSPLAKIDRTNVEKLGLAWSYELGSTRGVEATPIVVDGVMYVSGAWSLVFALDAASGKLLWKYDPQVPGEWARHACCDVVNRGVAVWDGAVFVGTLDGRLVSLDAATGQVNWEVLTIDRKYPYTITGAPRVVKGKVVIGNGGAELGVRGYVTAYDAKTGAELWRFYTVPGDPSLPFEHPELEAAAKTWTGEWWKIGGGGTAWDSMAYDPELDLLYVGTGNGSPWTRMARSPGGGDNLFLCSILALRPDDGKLVWHYQTTPGDNWDYTSVQPIVLADLELDGAVRKVLMQAPKNGFFYVLDRATGALISAEPYVTVTWASGVDAKTGRPVETEQSNYDGGTKLILPGPVGGHNWHPMAYSPKTRLVYLPAHDMPFWYAPDAAFVARPVGWNTGLGVDALVAQTEKEPPALKGRLLAWDPAQKRVRWGVEHAGSWNSGVLSTAGGLVFQGSGDGLFRAYNDETGEVLFEERSQTGIIAAPISYEIGGEQYVAVAAGWGGGIIANGLDEAAAIATWHNQGRVLVWKLGGSAAMPTNPKRDRTFPPPPALEVTAEQVEAGKKTYNANCTWCHGFGAASSFLVPDLRMTSAERHQAFEDIVLRGTLRGTGMPPFEGVLTADEVAGVRAYIVSEARKAYEKQQRPTN